MVKSARSKALTKSRQNRQRFIIQKESKRKIRVRWNIIRSIFRIFTLFFKSRNKKLNKNIQYVISKDPTSSNSFSNKEIFFNTNSNTKTTNFITVDCEKLGNRYETITTVENVISERTHMTNLGIIKNILNSMCNKVSRLVLWREYGFRKYQLSPESREKKKRQQRYSYNNDKMKRMKRLKNNLTKYRENKKKRDEKKKKQKEIYLTNELCRQKKRDISRRKYENQLFRYKKCCYLKDIYQKNADVRQRKCEQLSNRYQQDESIRKRKCEQLSNKYQQDENIRKRKCEQLQIRYQENEPVRKKKCKQLRETYKTNDIFRGEKRKKSRLRYNILEKRQHVLFCRRQRYRNNLQLLKNEVRNLLNTCDSVNRQVNENELNRILLKTKITQSRLYAVMVKQIREKYVKQTDQRKRRLDFYEQQFHNCIEQMPKYVCTICHRCMFQSDVRVCDREKYKKKAGNDIWLSITRSFSAAYVDKIAFDACKRIEWICNACHNTIWKGMFPTRSILTNHMFVRQLPDEIQVLNDLERHLIALRLPFMKMISLPKGSQKGCKGPVICVPSEVQDTANILPRHPSKSAFIQLKLKRRLNYRGWYKYQTICPDRVRDALRLLREINENYKNTEIDDNNYDYFHWKDTLICNVESDDNTVPSIRKKNQNDNEKKNEEEEIYGDEEDDERDPRKKFSIPTDTCLQSNVPEDYVDFQEDIISIAPAEKNRPASLLKEKGLEAKAFPHLFPDGKNTYDEERENKIKFSTYANNRLFSADFRYASDPHYIFFLQYLNDIQYASSGISLQLRKSCSKSQFTIQSIANKKYLSNMLKKDMIFKHLIKVRGSPQYWSKTLSELFAMIRQLGIPTWFCSFSAADARWIDLLHCLADYQNIPRKKNIHGATQTIY